MNKLSIEEFAYCDPYGSGIGERNTVSSGVDSDPNQHTNDLLASHFENCMRHSGTQGAITNVLSATGSGINIGGHGDSGFLETGGGQNGPFPDNMCIYLYNEYTWGPYLDQLKAAAVTTISIWSCHVGAEQDGADLLYAMARHAGHTVRAGTGFLYTNSEKTWWQDGTVWQVATPNSRPNPIQRPPGGGMTMMSEEPVFFVEGSEVHLHDIESIIIEPVSAGRSLLLTPFVAERQNAQALVKQLFVAQPMDFNGTAVAAMVTAKIYLQTNGGQTISFIVLNGGLAIDRQSQTGFYLRSDPSLLTRRE